jgi:autotransporter-associated beta strand protein
MKRSRLAKSRSRRLSLGWEQLEVRRVLDASAMPIWDQMPNVAGQALTVDAGMTATAAAQFGDFTYTTANGEVTITGYTGAGGAVAIPADIAGLPVRAIGFWAFADKATLTSVYIPGSVTSIGSEAFASSDGLTTVIISEGVTSIGSGAFAFCTGLTSVTIPASVTNIGSGAFNGCTNLLAILADSANTAYASLDGVLYNKSLTSLIQCPAGKAGSVLIPSRVTRIVDFAFLLCTSLTNVTIPASVTSIGSSAFRQCTSLTSANIPEGVMSIGDGAFFLCASLTSVTMPSSVTSIGDRTFEACVRLISVAIPLSVTSIGSKAFSGCRSLTSVTIPRSVTSIGSSAFAFCDSLTSVNIPESVSSIGGYAFSDCTSLTSVLMFGDSPAVVSTAFANSSLTIFRQTAASGWSITFGGRPVKIFEPFDVSAGQVVTPTISASTDRVLKQGTGTAVLISPSTRTGGTVVEAGELIVQHKDALGSGLLEVQAGAKATLQAGYDTVAVTSLAIADTARLELGTGKLAISANGFTESDIRSKLIVGRNGGTWNGSSGITSTFAGVDRTIGYRVADGVMEVAFAAPGDSNLDGQIDILDLSEILSAGKFNSGAAANWTEGDTNYDGVFDILDLSEILGGGLFNQGNYLTQGAVSGDAAETGTVATFDQALVFAALAMETGDWPVVKRKSL